jgi:hypothetical protein
MKEKRNLFIKKSISHLARLQPPPPPLLPPPQHSSQHFSDFLTRAKIKVRSPLFWQCVVVLYLPRTAYLCHGQRMKTFAF